MMDKIQFQKRALSFSIVRLSSGETPKPTSTGLEEMQRVYARALERVEGYQSVASPDSKWVVVIGQDLAQKFPGLQVFASIWSRRIVIDRGKLIDTLVQAAQRGEAIHFYGDSVYGDRLRRLADTPGFKMPVIVHDPVDWGPTFLMEEILKNLGIPSEISSTGLEEFRRDLGQLGEAA